MDQQRADRQSLHGGDLVGGYRIVELIGQGGMGDVFRAWDERLRRPVAIKAPRIAATFDEVGRKRFLRETRVACRVTHPYVATVYDVIEERGQPYLVMEFIEGTGFDEVLRLQQLPTDVITRYALEIAEALAAIHAEGIVHRDLKPANVMVTRAGHVKVMDFGVALPGAVDSTSGDPEATLTRDGNAVGTIHYMSPEQVAGRRPDPRSDLFALGIVLYEAITRQHPFVRDSPLAIASAIASDAPGGGAEPPTLSKSGPLRHLVMKLLEKDPNARYESAESLIADLRAIIAGEPLPSLKQLPRPRPRRFLVPAVVGIVIVAALSGVWAWRQRSAPPPAPPPRSTAGSVPGILVLPFDGATSGASGDQRGAMIASLLRAELAGVPSIRVVGSTRTDDLVAQWRETATGKARGGSLVQLAAVRYLVSGRFEADDSTIRLAVDVYDGEAPDAPIDFVVEASSLKGISDRLAAGFRAHIPSLDFTEAKGGAQAETLASFSDVALLSAERGRQARDHGDLKTAGREYDAALRDDPNFLLAYLERARLLYDAGFVTRARESVDAAAAVVAHRSLPLPDRMALEVAAVRAQVEEKREAEIDARRRIADAAPSDPDAWADLANALARANRQPEALAALDSAIALRPMDASLALDRAGRLRLVGRAADARLALDSAKQFGPNPPQGRWAARLLRETGYQERAANNFPAARAAFEKACDILAGTGDPLLLADTTRSLAETYLREGKPAEAIPILERASLSMSAAGNLRFQAIVLDTLGASRFQVGKYAEAESNLREAIALGEQTEGLAPRPNPFLNLASVLSYTGRFEEAAILAARAGEIATRQGDSKRAASALLQSGVALACQGSFKRSIDAYEATIRATGTTPPDERAGWALSGIAEVRTLRGELGSALEAADRSVALQRETKQQLNLAYALVGRARIRRFVGDRAGAAADIALAREAAGSGAAPIDLTARIDLDAGLTALEDGDLQAAESSLRAASQAPAAADLTGYANAGLAGALCRAGQFESGLAAAAKALTSPATFSERLAANVARGFCLTRSGRSKEGSLEAERAAMDAAKAEARWASIAAASVLAEAGDTREGTAELLDRGAKSLAALISTVPQARRDAFLTRPFVQYATKHLAP